MSPSPNQSKAAAPPNPPPNATTGARRAVRWVAPGASQAISSVGNAVLVIVGARWMSQRSFGDFSLTYAGVLLVSQLMRVALGEASLLGALSDDDRHRSAPLLLGSAWIIAPLLGVVAIVVTAGAARDVSLAIAVGAAVCLVSTTEITRYALLALGLVRNALVLDTGWTLIEFALLAVARIWLDVTPAILLWCWSLSAAVTMAPSILRIRPRATRAALRHTTANQHWWRLTLNESLLTATSYTLLAVLAATAGTAAVGALRASLLPFLWVQLSLAAAWLVVLSRRPSERRLARLVGVLTLVLSAAIVLTVIVVHLLPQATGRRLLHDNWAMTRHLVDYAGLTFVCLAIAEVGMLRLKAIADTTGVLHARAVYAVIAGFGMVVVAFRPAARTALLALVVAHLGAAVAIQFRLRQHRQAST